MTMNPFEMLSLGISCVLLSLLMTNLILIFIWRKLEQIRAEVEYTNLEDDDDIQRYIEANS